MVGTNGLKIKKNRRMNKKTKKPEFLKYYTQDYKELEPKITKIGLFITIIAWYFATTFVYKLADGDMPFIVCILFAIFPMGFIYLPLFMLMKRMLFGKAKPKCHRCRKNMKKYEHLLNRQELDITNEDLIAMANKEVYLKQTEYINDDKFYTIAKVSNIWCYCEKCKICFCLEKEVIGSDMLLETQYQRIFNSSVKLLKDSSSNIQKSKIAICFLRNQPTLEEIENEIAELNPMNKNKPATSPKIVPKKIIKKEQQNNNNNFAELAKKNLSDGAGIDLIKANVAIMLADGIIDDKENEYLVQLANNNNISKETVENIIQDISNGSLSPPTPTSIQEAKYFLDCMIQMCFADGNIGDVEKEVLNKLIVNMGYTTIDVNQAIKREEMRLYKSTK